MVFSSISFLFLFLPLVLLVYHGVFFLPVHFRLCELFAAPAAGAYGTMSVASLRAPDFWDWDQTISRRFRITETQRLEFRAEASNLTLSVRLYRPTNRGNNLQLGNNQFGQMTTDTSITGSISPTGSGGRIVQLALKYVF